MNPIIIPTDNDFNSTLTIGTESFPFQLFQDNLENFDGGFVNWHKQRQIEISVLLEGSVKVNVLQKETIVRQGDGFVILPGCLHAVKPNPPDAGRYFTMIFDPSFLCGYSGSFFEKSFYAPLRDSDGGCCAIPHDALWAQPVFKLLHWVADHADDDSNAGMLAIQRKIQDAWMLMYPHLSSTWEQTVSHPQNGRIYLMIDYLHRHYNEKFSLTSLAQELHVSRGECCRLFKKMLQMTLVQYLTEYRITKAVELLKETSMNSTEIAQAVGFGSTSSFIARFKEKMRVSPMKYKEIISE